MLEHVDENSQAYKALQARIGTHKDTLSEACTEEGHKFYKIRVTDWHVFGRFGAPSGQKYSLKWEEA